MNSSTLTYWVVRTTLGPLWFTARHLHETRSRNCRPISALCITGLSYGRGAICRRPWVLLLIDVINTNRSTPEVDEIVLSAHAHMSKVSFRTADWPWRNGYFIFFEKGAWFLRPFYDDVQSTFLSTISAVVNMHIMGLMAPVIAGCPFFLNFSVF